MYDNNNSIDTQISSNRGNLVRATKGNQCPHCNKTDWCYFIGELSVCNRDQPPATGWEATSKTDKDGHYFYARPQEKKAIRPRQTRYWTYSDRAGNPLVRVVRFDDGEGSKANWTQQSWGKCKSSRQTGWIGGTEGIERENIPIYRYADVKKAIANNELIFIVEGESCADILWDLGLAATCNIGGSKKWRPSDTTDLEGAKVVICPDRDEPGIEHANLLHQEFPDALWLYAYPDSPAWNNLPKSQGLDIKDWMDSYKVTRTDILAAVGEKKETQQIPKVDRQLKPKALDFSVLSAEIDKLLAEDLKPSELRVKLAGLSQEYRISPQEAFKIYQEKQHEQEQEQEQENTATEVARLIASKSASLKLSEILPETLAEPIDRLAKMLNLKPECYLLALLTQCGSLLRADTSTMLHPQTNYRVRPNYFGAIVAESSQKKTPILRAIVSDPMEKLLDKARSDFEGAEAVYEIAMNEWKTSKRDDKGPAPTPPVRKVYSFTKPTGEGIAAQAGRLPEQGMLYLCDELAGMLKSVNQYRGGKGSDEEDMLEYWSGGGAIVLRVSGITVDVRNVSLSIFGNIQPKVLAGFIGDGDDNNGKFARFDFVQQPLAATELSRDSLKVDLTPMLTVLYERLDTLSLNQFELDDAACDLFISFYNHCDAQRRNHPKQGMRAMLGKASEKVGKLATIIHCIHAAHRGEKVSKYISVESVRAAIKFTQYTTEQALNINLEVSEPSALAPNLVKIISLAERKGGTVSARDVSKAFDSKHRPTGQQIREWFGELASMKYGEVTSKGQSISFITNTLSPVSPVAQNQDSVRIPSGDNPLSPVSPVSPLISDLGHQSGDKWGYSGDNLIPTLESLPSKALEVSGDTGDTKTPPSEISQPLMQSCTTPKATKLDLKIGDAVVVAYSDVSMYRGQKGRIVTVRKSEVIVWFDKLVHGVEKALFPLSDILRI
ncbi:MAG: DUF3987 domain-containing protein [Microcoleus sp.]